MFTGIVAAVGRIVSVAPGPSARRLVVETGALDVADVGIGDSVAVLLVCPSYTDTGIDRPNRSRARFGWTRPAR